ncbi:MAG: hypothetical protein PVJ02_16745 [Gemmatimonadota bacterium]|jgi:hypothetical protein
MKRDGLILTCVVGGLLALTVAGIGAVAYHVVRASADASTRKGLDYETFLTALDELIREAGSETLVRVDPVRVLLPDGEVVSYDTLVVVADTVSFPSFRPAGFLHDQVDVYNRFQRRRLALAREEPGWFHRLQAHNPSVFRTRWTGGDAPELTRSTEAWSLRVRSPAEEEWDGEIRARDVQRGNGLLGPRATIPLREPVRLTRRVRGRRQVCEFTPEGLAVRAYCMSEERIPQAILRLASGDGDPGSVRAGWADLWVDGRRVSAGDSVPLETGAVLGIDPLEPVVFGEYWDGVLSSKQWINGRMRRRSASYPPLDMFSALGNRSATAAAEPSSTSSLRLSVDSDASRGLTRGLSSFVKDLPLDVDFAIVVLGRIPDGEILAVAEVGDRPSRGRSNLLERVTPGSAVKPLLAAAILSQRPELATLEIPAHSGPVTSVLGLPAIPRGRAFRSSLNCAPPSDGWLDLEYFLRCSNNEYAASLLMAGIWDGARMTDAGGRGRFRLRGRVLTGVRPDLALRDGAVPRERLLRSSVSEGLNELFDVATDPVVADAAGRSSRVWQGLTFSDGTPVDLPREVLPSASRPALLAPSAPEATDVSLLYRYAFGAWENGWTLLDLVNGFGRVVTDQRMQLTFVPSAPRATAPEPLGLRKQAWYPRLLHALGDVPIDGTARGLLDAWRRAGLPADVYAKTGTLAEAGGPGAADDLYVKSLLFAVGESSRDGGDRLRCGVVGGIYLRFREAPHRGSLPSYQVEFARGELASFLARRWEGFGVCAG